MKTYNYKSNNPTFIQLELRPKHFFEAFGSKTGYGTFTIWGFSHGTTSYSRADIHFDHNRVFISIKSITQELFQSS